MTKQEDQPQAILLDAVGTLVHPEPPVAVAYAAVARSHGIELPGEEIQRRFRAALRRQEAVDEESGFRTDEARERERWRAIVAEVFADQPEPLAPFAALWAHFAQAAHWAVYPEAPTLLRELSANGVRLALGSNFDARLRLIVAGTPAFATLERLFISSEVGWKKPAAEFYRHVLETLRLKPEALLVVGDDPRNDWEAPRALGIRAALIERTRGVDLTSALAACRRRPSQ